MVGCIAQHFFYKNYGAKEDGTVLNLRTGRALKPYYNYVGYARVGVCVRGKRKNVLVSRFVYECFKGEIQAEMDIDHINHDYLNNHVDNLQVLTRAENVVKSVVNKKDRRPVTAACLDTNETRNFISIGECAKTIKISRESINNVLTKKRPFATSRTTRKRYSFTAEAPEQISNFNRPTVAVRATCLMSGVSEDFPSICQAAIKLEIPVGSISKIVRKVKYHVSAQSKKNDFWYRFEKIESEE